MNADNNGKKSTENGSFGKTHMVTLERLEATTFVTGASETSTVDQKKTTYPTNYTGTL